MVDLSRDATLENLRELLRNDNSRAAKKIETLMLEYQYEEGLPNGADESGLPVQARLGRLLIDVEKVRSFETETEGLRVDLVAAGFKFEELIDLDKVGAAGAAAVPILCHWLPFINDRSARRTIVALLHNGWASPAAIEPLLTELRRLNTAGDPDPGSFGGGWGVVSALTVLIGSKDYRLLVDIAADPLTGPGRQLAVEALGKMRSKRDELTGPMLSFLNSDDPRLFRPAAIILARWKVGAAAPRVSQLLGDVNIRPVPADARYEDAYRAAERSELNSALRKLSADD